MTQEDRGLLIKDLCARLPFGVKGRVYAECTNVEYDMNGDMIFFDSPFDVTLDDINISTEELHVVAIGNEDTIDFIEEQQAWGDPYTIDEFKPYLRPLSSMSKEEHKKLDGYMRLYSYNTPHRLSVYCKTQDYLNSIHIDYRGLIEMNLAIEAPEGMYNI